MMPTNNTTKRWGMIVVAGSGLLAAALGSGCASYANVPGPSSPPSIKNPNARNPVGVVAEALRWTTNKFPVDGEYAVELTAGTNRESAQKILAGLPQGAEQLGWSDRGLPAFHVGRTWIRSGLAKVDIYRPVIGTRIAGGRMAHQRIVVWMEGGLEPWHVVRSQRGPIGAMPRQTESFAPPGLLGAEGSDKRPAADEGGTIYTKVPAQAPRYGTEPQPEHRDEGGMQPIEVGDTYMPPSDVPMPTPQPAPSEPTTYPTHPSEPSAPTPQPSGDGMILIEPLSSGSSYTPPSQPDTQYATSWPTTSTPQQTPMSEPDSGSWVHVTTSEPSQSTPNFEPMAPSTLAPVQAPAPAPTGDGVVTIESLDPNAPLQGSKATWADTAEMVETAEYHPMPSGGEGVPPEFDPFAVSGQVEVIESAAQPEPPKKQVQDSIVIEPTK